MAALDFDRAIAAHSEWKRKLSDYLKKPDGSLQASDVAVDNKCVLGQWIYGEGAQYSSLPAYSQLKSEHTRFHKAAAQIVSKIESGEKVTDAVALASNGEFGQSAARVILAIGSMRDASK